MQEVTNTTASVVPAPLEVRMDGHHLILNEQFTFDTRCAPAGCESHAAEYARAFAYIAERVGRSIDLQGPDTHRLHDVPLYRERFKTALSIFRTLGGTATEPERQQLHYYAGKLFADDPCAALAVFKREQSAPRVAKMSLSRVFQLRDFVVMHGRFPSEGSSDHEEKYLAKWLAKQRRGANSFLQVHLNRHVPMWRFSGRDGTWRVKLSLVVGFMEEFEREPNRNSTDDFERKLGCWVHN